MNVQTGEIVEIYLKDGKPMGKIRIGESTTNVGLTLLMSARVRDQVTFASGIALSVIEKEEITAV